MERKKYQGKLIRVSKWSILGLHESSPLGVLTIIYRLHDKYEGEFIYYNWDEIDEMFDLNSIETTPND